jgi:hypothetical protein
MKRPSADLSSRLDFASRGMDIRFKSSIYIGPPQFTSYSFPVLAHPDLIHESFVSLSCQNHPLT